LCGIVDVKYITTRRRREYVGEGEKLMNSRGTNMRETITRREEQLIMFLREIGWGEVRLKVQEGQPVLIIEALKTVKLDEEPKAVELRPVRKKRVTNG